jgi:hypothetical protein
VVFFVVRAMIGAAAARIPTRASQAIEHLCDLYAAERMGAGAMVNVLLKIGEEEELVEVVLTRAARKLRHVTGVETEDLAAAFEAVRPYGRIFHDNLLRHASQVVTKTAEDAKPSRFKRRRKEALNAELQAVLDYRKKTPRRRTRWRDFDVNGDGRLSDGEIGKLCQALREHPERTLFRCESELTPTTHPACRTRILFLEENLQG